jgi:hypothetical protein
MWRDLIDRFAYRYRRWSTESRSRNLGAGATPPEISPRSESAFQLILRLLQVMVSGLLLLIVIYRILVPKFTTESAGLSLTFIFLSVVWCGIGLFMMGGELLAKWSTNRENRENDEQP